MCKRRPLGEKRYLFTSKSIANVHLVLPAVKINILKPEFALLLSFLAFRQSGLDPSEKGFCLGNMLYKTSGFSGFQDVAHIIRSIKPPVLSWGPNLVLYSL